MVECVEELTCLQGLPPHEATPETRAAFQAASKAFSSMAPYYMPIYQPFGVPATPGPGLDPAAGDNPVAGVPAAETHARARQVANAAVAASIAATKQLLQGQISLLQERLSSLEAVEEAALRPPQSETAQGLGAAGTPPAAQDGAASNGSEVPSTPAVPAVGPSTAPPGTGSGADISAGTGQSSVPEVEVPGGGTA